MREYVKKISEKPDFKQNGFDGYIANTDNKTFINNEP